LDYLQCEQATIGKIMGQTSGLNSNSRPHQGRPAQTSNDDSAKKKLNLFLGKK